MAGVYADGVRMGWFAGCHNKTVTGLNLMGPRGRSSIAE
jgi:hypothetical protein